MALYPEIYEGVNAQVPASVVPAERFAFGAENLGVNASPPRVVWVPGHDSFGPASQRGSARGDGRAIHTARTAVEAHLWGTDTAGALAIRDAFVQALRAHLGANYHLDGGRWEGQDIATAGRKYVLSFFLDIPILDGAIVTTATPVNEDQSDVGFSVPPPN